MNFEGFLLLKCPKKKMVQDVGWVAPEWVYQVTLMSPYIVGKLKQIWIGLQGCRKALLTIPYHVFMVYLPYIYLHLVD